MQCFSRRVIGRQERNSFITASCEMDACWRFSRNKILIVARENKSERSEDRANQLVIMPTKESVQGHTKRMSVH